VDVDQLGLALRLPFATRILEVADQLFARDDRHPNDGTPLGHIND